MSKDNKQRMHVFGLWCEAFAVWLSMESSPCCGCVNVIHALLRLHVSAMSWTDGREDLMIFYAVLINLCLPVGGPRSCQIR